MMEQAVEAKYDQLRRSSRKRGLKNNLSKRYIRALLNHEICMYSGERFGSGEDALSVERVNPYKGYVRGNVIPIKIKYNNVRGSDADSEETQNRIDGLKENIANRLYTQSQVKKQMDVLQREIDSRNSKKKNLKTDFDNFETKIITDKKTLTNLEKLNAGVKNFEALSWTKKLKIWIWGKL